MVHCVLKMDSNRPKQTQPIDPDTKLSLKQLPELLTVKEVADLLRVSPQTVKRWDKRGKLVSIRINARGDRRYRKEAILWLLGINPEELD